MLTILSLLTLTACASGPPRLSSPPADLVVTRPEPPAPALAAIPWDDGLAAAREAHKVRSLQELVYIDALRVWGGLCYAEKAGLQAWVAAVED